MMRLGVAGGLHSGLLGDLAEWLRCGRVDQKRADALDMIAAIRDHLAAGVTPLRAAFRFHDTGYHKAAARRTIEGEAEQTNFHSGSNPEPFL